MTDVRGNRKCYRILETNRRQAFQDITSAFNRHVGKRFVQENC